MSHLYKLPMQFSSVCRSFDPHLLQNTIKQLTLNTFLLSVSGSKIVKRIKPNQNNIMILK